MRSCDPEVIISALFSLKSVISCNTICMKELAPP